MKALAHLYECSFSHNDILMFRTQAYVDAVREACEKLDFSELFDFVSYSNIGHTNRVNSDCKALLSYGKIDAVNEIQTLIREALKRTLDENTSLSNLPIEVLVEYHVQALEGTIGGLCLVPAIREALLEQCIAAEDGMINATTEGESNFWENQLWRIREHAPKNSVAYVRALCYFTGLEHAQQLSQIRAFLEAKVSGDPKVMLESIKIAESWWKEKAMDMALDFAEVHAENSMSVDLVMNVLQKSTVDSEQHLRAARWYFHYKESYEKREYVYAHNNKGVEAPKLVTQLVELGLALPKVQMKPSEYPLPYLNELCNYYWMLQSVDKKVHPQVTRTKKKLNRKLVSLMKRFFASNPNDDQLYEMQQRFGGFLKQAFPAYYLQLKQVLAQPLSQKD